MYQRCFFLFVLFLVVVAFLLQFPVQQNVHFMLHKAQLTTRNLSFFAFLRKNVCFVLINVCFLLSSSSSAYFE